MRSVWAVAAAGADIVVHQPGIMAGHHIAEKLRVPVAITLTPAGCHRRGREQPRIHRGPQGGADVPPELQPDLAHDH
jgi:hypothetical protein